MTNLDLLKEQILTSDNNLVVTNLTKEDYLQLRDILTNLPSKQTIENVIDFNEKEQLLLLSLIKTIPSEYNQPGVIRGVYNHYIALAIYTALANNGVILDVPISRIYEEGVALMSCDFEKFYCSYLKSAVGKCFWDLSVKNALKEKQQNCRVHFLVDNVLSKELQRSINNYFISRTFLSYNSYTTYKTLLSYTNAGDHYMRLNNDYKALEMPQNSLSLKP